jgi:DNA-directed RNA polymerase specialized sigma24 family protein
MADAIPLPPRLAFARSPLAEGLLGGDPRAFAEFYDFFFPRVWRFARRRAPDPQAAERLTAGIFEAVVAALAAPLPDDELAHLVFATARRVAAGAGERRATGCEASPGSRPGGFVANS